MKLRASTGLPAALAALLLIALIAGCERQPASGPAGTPADQANQPMAPPLPGAAGDNTASQRAGNAVADAAITARVKAALGAEPTLKAIDIKVDTVNGVVTLSGTIDTPHNLERATQVAKAVEGVKSVSNQLNVKAPT